MAFFLYRHTPFAFGIDVVYSYILAGLFLYILSLFPSIILVSKMITKPLVSLTKSIQQFAEGQQNVKVQFKYTDEIGLLGKAFNDMVLDNERLRFFDVLTLLWFSSRSNYARFPRPVQTRTPILYC